MNILTSLIKRRNIDKFRLKYNKKDSEWVVMKAKDLIYAGTQRQCEQFLERNHDAYI